MFHMFSTYDSGSIAQMPIAALTTERALELARLWLAEYDHGFTHAIVVNDAQAVSWMFLSADKIHERIERFIGNGAAQDLLPLPENGQHVSPDEASLSDTNLIPAQWVGVENSEEAPVFEACEEGTCFNCCDPRG